MISRLLLWCVLRLFPAEFRLRFEEEIEEYWRLRHLEVRADGGASTNRLPLELVSDLAIAAVRERLTDFSASNALSRLLALAAGLVIAGMLFSVVFIAFESLVRLPLLALAKQGTVDRAAPIRVVVMLLVVLALLGLHVSLFPYPDKRRQPPK